MEKLYDLIIIGSGPAGMSAAIYASRGGISTLILEKEAPGGKMLKTDLIENYPGIEEISGIDLSMTMNKHSLNFGAEYNYGDVTEIIKEDNHFKVVATTASFRAKSVIIATGSKEREMGLANEAALLGKGVSYCAVCDGLFFKDESVVVVGAGNSALQAALYLSRFVKEVTIVMRRDVFRADDRNQQLVFNNKKIKILQHYVPHELVVDENGLLSQVAIKHVKNGEVRFIEARAIFPYIGQIPATQMVEKLNILDEGGYVLVDENMQTAIPGLFSVGDVNHKDLRQIVTAVNDGAIAAQHIINTIIE